MALARRTCAHHPDRPGHALCMACRKALCRECATEWDGINYCASCLAQRRRSVAARGSLLGWLGLVLAVGLLFLGLPHVVVWAGVLLLS